MSPKTSTLAYDELKVRSSSVEEMDFTPELNLIITKRHSLDACEENRAISISGTITVSF